MTPVEKFNDDLRQKAHADKIKAERSPQQDALTKQVADLQKQIADLRQVVALFTVNGLPGFGPGGIFYTPPPAAGGPGQGFTGAITVCVDNGDSTFTQKTANFINGTLQTVT